MAKQRSPNYPSVGLGDAIASVKLIYEKEKRTQVSGEVIATAMGYKSLSGPVRAKIAALKKYGLLDGDERKGLKVSDLSMRILYPSDLADALEAKRKAALSPELFKSIFDEMREGSDSAILSTLVNKKGFAPGGAKQAIAAYRDTVMFAELGGEGYNAYNTPDKNEAANMQTQNESAATTQASFRTNRVDFKDVFASTDAYVWPLSKPRGVRAELRITGDYTRADLDRLKKQIDILVESLDDDEGGQQ